MTIEVCRLSKRFGAFQAVDDASIKVQEGSLTALLGPSGSGKTTVLRLIAGLETPDAGSIVINGVDVAGLTPQKRNVGFVFQHYALFKHMRVADNIAFPLKVRKWRKNAVLERVDELLALLRLDGLGKRYPDQISGGQRQRVALARALAAYPQILLLDEPFSALDARVRDELREWLRSLHDQLHVTSLFVTHDQTEALEIADSVVVMRDGRVIQTGSPAEVVAEPNSPYVMNFLGRANALSGSAGQGEAEIHGLRLPFETANGVSQPVVAYFRPQHVSLSREPATPAWPARVERVVASGLNTRVHMTIEATAAPFVAEIDAPRAAELGIVQGSLLYASPRGLRIYPA